MKKNFYAFIILISIPCFAFAATPVLTISQVPTQVTFSAVTGNSATVTISPGTDLYNLTQNRTLLMLRYAQDNLPNTDYHVHGFAYNEGSLVPLPLTLSNLSPNTAYRIWYGYTPTTCAPSASNCTNTVTQPIWSTQSFVFTTTTNDLSLTTSVGDITLPLVFGTRSNQVVTLQEYLAKHGFYPANIDGIFGPITKRAVKNFQLAYTLLSDGKVGYKTRIALNASMTRDSVK
jgi:hypothetical protein